jgi:cytoskeletal protein RodZ
VSELGQVLQRAREEKGISLDDIQRITKIQRRYLEAIERGHFHVLPGHFYARAFIKSYAEAVGLDPNHIMSHFQSDLPAQPPQEQVERLRRRRAAAASQPLQAGRWVTKTLLVLFIALIIGVIYIAVVNSNDLETRPVPGNNNAIVPEVTQPQGAAGTPVTPPPAAQAPQPPATTEQPPLTTPAPQEQKPALAFESQQGTLYNYTLAGGEKITVKLKAVQDKCWFGVAEAKGKKFKVEGTLQKGEEKVVELGKTAFVRLGKPSAVEMTVNDQPVETAKMKVTSNIQVKIQPTLTQ